MKYGHFNPEQANRILRERYNIHFVDLFIRDGFKVYLFGGSLRDMVLGKEWKDADIRAWIPLPPKERDQKTEDILKEAKVIIKAKIIFNEKFTIYRILPVGGRSNEVIDFTVVTEQFGVIPDFTINGLYFDIDTKELIDRHHALEDIERGVIRTILNPDEQFTLEPHMVFRVVKCACQFGFDIEEKTFEAMKKLSGLNKETLEIVIDNTFEGMTEWFIGNIFRGIKYNPRLFIQLWNETGLTKLFIECVSNRLIIKSDIQNISNSIFDKDKEYSYEESLSLFISTIANAIYPKNGKATFDKIIELFRLNMPSVYGDFVVNISEIIYKSSQD